MRARRSPLLALTLCGLVLAALVPSAVRAEATTYRLNLYRSAGYLTQDPYYTACTAASAMMMLNFIALTGSGGNGFRWRTNRVKNSLTNYEDLTSILWWERAHDTLAAGAKGSDAHGWRNAMNQFGWGTAALTDPSKRVYDDLAFNSFDAAVRAAVKAIAVYRKPVGMLGWAGQHAQVITGYVVTGADPAVSDDFTVAAVYLSDPLQSDQMPNNIIGIGKFRTGWWHYRFQAYRMVDSPYDDPYTPGWRRSSVRSLASEWYQRWVIIAPIRYDSAGSPPPPPTPTPTPTASPTPTSTSTSSPTASSTAQAAPTATSTPSPTTATATPVPTPTPTSTPVATPTPTSTPAATSTSSPSAPASPSPSG